MYAYAALECPVCLALPEGEVHQCLSGHCYCVDCWLRLAPRRCPECRQPLPQANRNRAAERAIAALKHHVVVAHECTADGPGLDGKCRVAPVRSSFTITARGLGGQRLCSGGGATFRVKVRGQGIVEPEVSDKLDGTYQVELTYPIPGKYEVLVSLDRTKMPIKGSPFAVIVHRPAPRYNVPPGWPPPLPILPPPPVPPASLVPPLEGTATVEGRVCDCGAAQGAAPPAGFEEVMARLELQVATTECEELRVQNQQLREQCDDLQQQVAVVCHELQQVHRQLRLMAGRVWRGPMRGP